MPACGWLLVSLLASRDSHGVSSHGGGYETKAFKVSLPWLTGPGSPSGPCLGVFSAMSADCVSKQRTRMQALTRKASRMTQCMIYKCLCRAAGQGAGDQRSARAGVVCVDEAAAGDLRHVRGRPHHGAPVRIRAQVWARGQRGQGCARRRSARARTHTRQSWPAGRRDFAVMRLVGGL